MKILLSALLCTWDQLLSSTCEWSSPKPSSIIYHAHTFTKYRFFCRDKKKLPSPSTSNMLIDKDTPVCTVVHLTTVVYLWVEFAEASNTVHLLAYSSNALIFPGAKKKPKKLPPSRNNARWRYSCLYCHSRSTIAVYLWVAEASIIVYLLCLH